MGFKPVVIIKLDLFNLPYFSLRLNRKFHLTPPNCFLNLSQCLSIWDSSWQHEETLKRKKKRKKKFYIEWHSTITRQISNMKVPNFPDSFPKVFWTIRTDKLGQDCCSLIGQSCPTLYDPMDCSPPGSSVLGFPRQEYWSGLPFPSPDPVASW